MTKCKNCNYGCLEDHPPETCNNCDQSIVDLIHEVAILDLMECDEEQTRKEINKCTNLKQLHKSN